MSTGLQKLKNMVSNTPKTSSLNSNFDSCTCLVLYTLYVQTWMPESGHNLPLKIICIFSFMTFNLYAHTHRYLTYIYIYSIYIYNMCVRTGHGHTIPMRPMQWLTCNTPWARTGFLQTCQALRVMSSHDLGLWLLATGTPVVAFYQSTAAHCRRIDQIYTSGKAWQLAVCPLGCQADRCCFFSPPESYWSWNCLCLSLLYLNINSWVNWAEIIFLWRFD